MKKKVFVFLIAALALMMAACSESNESGLDSWLETKGLPTNYAVQTLSIEGLKASSVETFLDTLPRSADTRAILGHGANLTHDMVMDIAFTIDSDVIKSFRNADSAGAYLLLAWLKDLYKDSLFPKDSLKVEEDVDIQITWMLGHGKKQSFADSCSKITDSMWYASMDEWKNTIVSNVTATFSLSKPDSSLRIELPAELVDSLKNTEHYTRLQMRLSAPNAARIYRFYGEDTDYPPYLTMYYVGNGDSTYYMPSKISRMANVVVNEEDCPECPILHGGVYDSIVVEIPQEPIMKALSEFYGDEFPIGDDEEFDVRQYVVLAQLAMARDDSQGSQELGLPIQVLVGSYVDSAETSIRRMENYRLNKDVILEDGHQNLVFHDGDSLKVQLTYGARDLINRGSDGRNLKFMMRLGYPFLQEKDTTYATYTNADGDTTYLYLGYFDYARYDFSNMIDGSLTLKLWLTSKRAFKEED